MSRSAGWTNSSSPTRKIATIACGLGRQIESDVRAPEQHHSLRGRRWLKDPAVLRDFPMAPLVFSVLSQAFRQGAFFLFNWFYYLVMIAKLLFAWLKRFVRGK